MRFSIASTVAIAGLATAAPSAPQGYNPFPLKDGFPSPSADQLKDIEKRAGGTLPNGPFPPNPNSPAAALDLQVIAFNEIFEVAYFTQLLQNVTDNKPGYEVPARWGKDYVVKLLKEVIAQEELHALLANTALKTYGGTPVTPAAYKFPVNDLLGALEFAGEFTSLVLGALQSVQVDLTTVPQSSGGPLIQLLGSIIGQEGEQTGLYRAVNGRVASASPFLTVAAGQFAYNALEQLVVVPGSNKNNIAIPAYDALTLNCKPQAKDSTLDFIVTSKTAPTTSEYITYTTGQNVPVSEPVKNIKSLGNGKYSFQAAFPFSSGGFSNGLTVAALTKSNGYANVAAVAGAASAGPGLIYLN